MKRQRNQAEHAANQFEAFLAYLQTDKKALKTFISGGKVLFQGSEYRLPRPGTYAINPAPIDHIVV